MGGVQKVQNLDYVIFEWSLILFNVAQPGVGRVQVLGSKIFQELLFGIDIKIGK